MPLRSAAVQPCRLFVGHQGLIFSPIHQGLGDHQRDSSVPPRDRSSSCICKARLLSVFRFCHHSSKFGFLAVLCCIFARSSLMSLSSLNVTFILSNQMLKCQFCCSQHLCKVTHYVCPLTSFSSDENNLYKFSGIVVLILFSKKISQFDACV